MEGKFIKEYREKYNDNLPPKLTQEAMGKIFGFRGRQGFYWIESGERDFTPEEIRILADTFGTTVEELEAEYEAWVLVQTKEDARTHIVKHERDMILENESCSLCGGSFASRLQKNQARVFSTNPLSYVHGICWKEEA